MIGCGVSIRGVTRRRSQGLPAISAVQPPATSVLAEGQSLDETAGWSTFLSAANYTTSAAGQTISTVAVNFTGSVPDATTAFAGGDTNYFTVTVTDTAGNSRVFVTAPRAVAYAAPTAAGGLSDQSFTAGTGIQTYDASGDFTGAALTFSATSLAGISINADTGVLSFDTEGLPVQSGTAIVVTATNSGGAASSGFSLTVESAAPPPEATAAGGLADADWITLAAVDIIDVDYTADFTANGNTLSYGFSGLPAGVTDNGDGTLSGTPAAAGSGVITVTATDQLGREVQSAFGYTVTEEADIDIVLLAGQSNMLGQTDWDNGANFPPGTYQWGRNLGYNNQIIPATFEETRPNGSQVFTLHHPQQNYQGEATTPNIALEFARSYGAAHPTRRILFVPAAFGATSFIRNHWNPGDGAYTDAVTRANAAIAAAPSARFLGILWHQGESDIIDGNTASGYETALYTMIAAMRADITAADSTTPFVLGQMVPDFHVGNAFREEFAAVIATADQNLPGTATASSAGLTSPDALHFDAASYRVLGQRYAAALLDVLQRPLEVPSINIFTVGAQSGEDIPITVDLSDNAVMPYTVHLVAVAAGAAAPDAAQVVAGLDGTDAPAAISAMYQRAADGSDNVTITVPADGSYDFHATVVDNVGTPWGQTISFLDVALTETSGTIGAATFTADTSGRAQLAALTEATLALFIPDTSGQAERIN